MANPVSDTTTPAPLATLPLRALTAQSLIDRMRGNALTGQRVSAAFGVAPMGAASGADPVSAASGLVLMGSNLVVIADDENALALFNLHDDLPGLWFPLEPAQLPPKAAERKAAKPDWECITRLPAMPGHPHGALLVMGSGSGPRRQRAALLRLQAPQDNGSQALLGPATFIDTSALCRALRKTFDDVNLEGVFLRPGDATRHPMLCFLQRANLTSHVNACIGLPWAATQAWLCGQGPVPDIASIHAMDLGNLHGVPLGFTDGVALSDGRWLFTAAAEATHNAYDDGACAGSVLGLVDATHRIVWTKAIQPTCKVEGLSATVTPEGLSLLLAIDADDRGVASALLLAALPASDL
jgi:hypothetical protein